MSAVTLTTQLRMWQWWNQPPTPPASQSGQFRDVVHIGVEGGWLPIPGDSSEKTETSVSDSYHVNYDMLEVPKGGTAVFQVTLNIAYEVANGTAGAFFAGHGRHRSVSLRAVGESVGVVEFASGIAPSFPAEQRRCPRGIPSASDPRLLPWKPSSSGEFVCWSPN